MMRTEHDPSDPRVLALAKAVEHDLVRAWTVPEMAAVLGISAGQLRRVVKEAQGATPRQWLCNLRLEQAARLLSDTRLRIKEVQARVGIADASHFARDFRDRFGTSPTEYRWHGSETAAASVDSHARHGQ
ncbi:MAG: helix-turn-helix transcriptional regulator [Vicinamibacterales bacterium]